jgi:hypothetical protein
MGLGYAVGILILLPPICVFLTVAVLRMSLQIVTWISVSVRCEQRNKKYNNYKNNKSHIKSHNKMNTNNMKQILTYSSNLLQGRNNFLLILLLAITSLVLPSTANAQGWFWDANDDPTQGSTPNWVVRGQSAGSGFSTGNLTSGIWGGGQTLDTRATDDFTSGLNIVMRYRADVNTSGTFDALMWVNRVPSSGGYGIVYASMQNNGTNQSLLVYHKVSNTETLLATYSGLSLDFQEIKFAFNSTNGLTVTINGTAQSALTYATNNTQNADRFVTIQGNNMQLDYICINNASCDVPVSAIYRGGSGSGSAVTGVTSFFALPVSLIDFKAAASKQNPKACLLEWQTSSESNSSHFDIEWSPSGAEWIKVGKVNTIGNSSTLQSYQFLHNETSVLNYYRLRHYDTDGSESLSDIRVVSLQSQVITPDINIYPNPSNSSIFVNTTFDSDISFEVSNNQGQVIQSGIFNKHLSLMNLTPGLYHLKLVSDNFTTTKKLIVGF